LNKILLEQISETIRELKALLPTDNILVDGDFNCVPDEWMDRFPTKYVGYEYIQYITFELIIP